MVGMDISREISVAETDHYGGGSATVYQRDLEQEVRYLKFQLEEQ